MFTSSPRTIDRLIGIVATLTGGLVFAFAHSWISRVLLGAGGKELFGSEGEGSDKSKSKSGSAGWFSRRKTPSSSSSSSSSPSSKGDESYQARYGINSGPLVLHNGQCHCQRVRFRIKAPQILKAVDIPSKIRFPRITIPCEYFEPLTSTDDGIMSLYAVMTESDPNIGVYTFCSFCGGEFW